jgi:copper transport protein
MLEEAALVLLLTIAVHSRARTSVTRRNVVLGLAFAGVAVVCEGLGSHSASISSAAVADDAVHLLAAALWLGAVAALAVAIWPAGALGRDGSRLIALACRRRFAWLAGAGAAVAVVTGLYSAGREVASIDALLTTFYGRALLVKTALVAALVMLGATNAALLTRAARARGGAAVAWLIVAETAVGAGAFLGAGVLTASSPARGPEFAAPRPVRAPMLAADVDDLIVSATVRPNRPGQNVLAVQAVSSRRPPPAPIESISAGLGSGQPIALRRLEPGRYLGPVTLSRAGPARMSLVVRRAGRTLPAGVQWFVDRPDAAKPVVVSSRRLSSIVDPLALALCIGLAAAGAFALLTRHLWTSVRSLPPYREEPS